MRMILLERNHGEPRFEDLATKVGRSIAGGVSKSKPTQMARESTSIVIKHI